VVYNIKIEVRKIGSGGMGLIALAKDRDQWRGLSEAIINVESSCVATRLAASQERLCYMKVVKSL
jgi:hypothetical protein